MLPITALIAASLQDIEHIVTVGHPALFTTTGIICLQHGLCILNPIAIIILMLAVEVLSLIRSTQSLSHIPLCRVCIVSNY
ncbi:hypothetical protein Psyc_0155 [Psychrobacter arcticus 273-4]|uniref:Uncharacterized protein n=1 Tax=Psychrobacter arcticus (strain DSM 17307 / VKM B-2377 / 273-4) TaxID=259536 RepID=Q4FVD0_PSYA2|nr:hypothetical protein Psyc_0155 [Psychrobacter arcticus 273-4]